MKIQYDNKKIPNPYLPFYKIKININRKCGIHIIKIKQEGIHKVP